MADIFKEYRNEALACKQGVKQLLEGSLIKQLWQIFWKTNISSPPSPPPPRPPRDTNTYVHVSGGKKMLVFWNILSTY